MNWTNRPAPKTIKTMSEKISIPAHDLELIREAWRTSTSRPYIDRLRSQAQSDIAKQILDYHVERVYFLYEERAAGYDWRDEI